ncbi:abnormal spindle-like microcephaly-associated protein isoform X2 [Narcine bancroftii]|uniref:abnormal spindle-like microcephaly-associated protein isoform X2 n=1 Tax=Narcine bancroftii TaxID=1343680 RepID=UPI0038318B4A
MDVRVRGPTAVGGPSRWPHHGEQEQQQEEETIPVLTLTHFARTPFLCFKTVRTGCSKTEELAVENPECVPVLVTVDKFPSRKGFAMSEREFVVEPTHRYYLSITWTPIEAGGVRETVTFSVGCVKVICILLGKAEDPPKKKRSLWESIKGKEVSQRNARLEKKRNPSIVSKTIIVSQKKDFVKIDRALTPLQPCENLGQVHKRIPRLHNLVDALEYDDHEQMHPLPILPPCQVEELENCTSQSFKRLVSCSFHQSKGTSLQTAESLENEKPDELCASELVKSRLSLESPSTYIFSAKTPQNFLCASAPQTLVNKRRILSPDSFVNDNYNAEIEPIVESSVLSPDQFLKDARTSMNQPWLNKDEYVEASSTENLKSGNSSLRESSPSLISNHGLRVINIGELKPATSRLTFCVNSKTFDLPQKSEACEQIYQSTAQTKMLPVFMTTDIKNKPVGYCELENKVKHSGSHFVEVDSYFQSRSVIDAETKTENRNPKLASRSSVPSRKRKSSEYLSNNAHGKDLDTNKRKFKRIEQSGIKSNVVKKTTLKYTTGGGKHPQKRKSVSQVKSYTVHVNSGKLMPGVPQSQLTFRKLTKTVIPRHPLPFAARNMFYDERWKEKQERGFTWWLNFILTPDDFTVNTESSRVNTAALFLGSETQYHKISVSSAPTNEEMSLRAYTAKCRLNHLRRTACRLFTSEKMVKVIQKLEAAIEAKHLLVRKDRCLWKDFGHRQKILKWLLSFNPLWLRIGLECVFGELIPLESNSDVTGLAKFILNRLLWNADIAAMYSHPTVPHLYHDEHQEVLAQFTLKKFLLLVWFLDCAKQSRLIDHDPCLFCKDAEFKMSKDLLIAFSRDFLSGEGDISRHLGFLGLIVSHCQMPLHEFNFAVNNLAVDLRCGIRLVRAVELLTQNWKLSKQLRVPAISRLQKLHNVKVALDALKNRVVLQDERGNDIDPRDIVDGHREKTLALLWRIISAFQMKNLLNEDQLQEEIEFLKTTWHTSHKLSAVRSLSVLPHAVKEQDLNCMLEKYSPQITLLMSWINAVENFTVAFSDGRVLCYLIHHYHPSLLPLDNICKRTTQTVECTQHGTIAIDTSTSESDESSIDAIPANSLPTASIYEELLENEKKNFNLVMTAVAELGGIPAMIRHMDMSNTIPDEKVVITYVSFLCARLLDLRKEARAARIIQAAWRKYKLNYELQLLKEKNRAASVIQASVRRYLHRQWFKKRNIGAIIIQTFWRSHVARQKAKALMMLKIYQEQNEAATLLQAFWRGYIVRRHFQKLRQYSIFMQSRIRMKIAVVSFKRIILAAVTIQRHFKAHLLRLSEQRNYLKLKASVLIIQFAFRRWRACKVEKQTKAIIVLQKYLRGFLSRRKYKWIQHSICLIQAHAKGFLIRTEMCRRKNAAITLNKYIKAYMIAKHEYNSYQRLKWAARVIQAAYLRLKARKLYHLSKSARLIQSTFRMHKQRKKFIAVRKAVIVIQTVLRTHLAHNRFLRCRHAAITLQRHFRAKQQGRKEMQHLLKLRQVVIKIQVTFRKRQARKEIRKNQAAVTIQRWYRMHRGKQKYQNTKKCCIRIQSWYRCCKAQRAFHSKKKAALVIQKYHRACRSSKAQREKYLRMLKATITIQAYFRGMTIRQLARKMKAACVIQSYWKMRKERLKFFCYKQCAVTLQSHVRRSRAQKRYHSVKFAICLLQSHFRAILAQKKAQAEYRALRSSAIILQSAYRRLQTRRQILLFQSVVKIQSAFRAYVSRKKFMQTKKAAVKIQAFIKMIQAQKCYRSLKKAALYIQRRYRANKLCLEKRKEYLRKKKACIYLQSAVRQHLAQKRLYLCQQAAIKIQSKFRMYRQKSQYLKIHLAVVTIQRGFHAYQEGMCQRQNFLKTKEAVTCLQAVYRGYIVRKKIKHQHNAASKIQAAFRGHALRMKYLAMQKAAIVIQNWYRNCIAEQQQRLKACIVIQSYFRMQRICAEFKTRRRAARIIQEYFRAHIQRNCQRQKYQNMKAAVKVLQSAFFSMKSRKRLKQMHKAATIIQRATKSFLAKKRYVTLKAASIVLQQQFRNLLLTRKEREIYLSIRRATLCIQAAYRSMKVRKLIRRKHKAATVIQAAFKMHRVYLPYRAMKLAAIVIQKHYKAYIQRKTDRTNYVKIHNSVLLLQAYYQGMIVRKHLRNMHKSARIIQTYYGMYKQHQHFKKLRWAATVIQQRYRASQIRNVHVRQYNVLKKATVCIQAAFRGMKSRQQMQRVHLSATVIQRRFRAYVDRKQYLLLRVSASIIQQRYRALVIARNQRQMYTSIWNATLSIQAAYRGMKVRRELQHKHKAAIVIQATFRMHRLNLPYRAMVLAARIIQNYYRAHLQRKTEQDNYVKIRNSVLLLQAAYRGRIVRVHLRNMHKSAGIIQAYYRMHKQYQSFQKLQWAATTIQQRYRACQKRDLHVRHYNTLRKATISIQAYYHAKKARKHFLIQRAAAVTLQTAFRAYRTRVLYRAMQLAAILIQQWYRACKIGRSQFVQYHTMRYAAIAIQAAYKGMVIRRWVKQKRAAVKIQSVLCMIRHRRGFLKLKYAAIVVQSHYRAYEAKKRYRAYIEAAVTLQNRYRSYLLMKKQRNAYSTLRQSIICLQARVRGFIVHRSYKKLHWSIMKIQACYRGKKQRQVFLLYKEAACVIQKHYRAYCQRKVDREKYIKMKCAVVIVQTLFRQYQARQRVRKTTAAQKIQAWFKSQVLRGQYKNFLATVIFIQRHYRAKQDRSRFLKIQVATIVIQRRWRMAIAARKLEQANLRKAMAAVKIQAFWKGFKVRRQMIKKHEAASQIQHAFRANIQRRKFLQQRKAAVVLQTHYRAWHLARAENMKYHKTRKLVIHLQSVCRGWLVRKKVSEKKMAKRKLYFAAAVYHNLCAIKIQKAYRGYMALKYAKHEINSVIYIQRWFRTCLQRRRYLNECEKIIVAQRTVKVWLMRRHKAAVVIQKSVRKFLHKIQKRRICSGIIKIQALWKGYWLRKKTSNPQMIAIRHRIHQANQNSHVDQKLCNRTATAIYCILKYKHFSDILAALHHLEVATRLSAICCENLAESGAAPIIFTLIRNCNRSVPCMDVIKHAVQVLLNLSKYEKTASVVYEVDNSIDILLDLLYMYRGKAGDKTSNKCGSIFTKVCCLLAILSQDSKKALEVRSLPKAINRIRNIHQLTVRKYKMDADRINLKQRNGSLFFPATPLRTRAVSKLKPDWVLRRDNMKEVVDPLKAIQLVMDTLGISI